MLKFICKATKVTGKVVVKLYSFCVFVYVANELAYLDNRVRVLEAEIDKLKADAKG